MADLRYPLTGINSSGETTPGHPGGSTFRYGPWHIQRADWTRPSAEFDWDWWHEDYDGAEDANDPRSGSGRTLDACINAINEHEED